MNTKKCPFCAEEIAFEAIKCKHCKEYINVDQHESNGVTEIVSYTPKPEYKKNILGYFLLLVPFIISIIMPFLIIDKDYDKTIPVLLFLSIICIITTSSIICFESNKLDMGNVNDINSKTNKKNPGPLEWFIATFLLWVFFFPKYLLERSKYGLKNLYRLGLVSMLILVISTIVWGNRVDLKIKNQNLENLSSQSKFDNLLNDIGISYQSKEDIINSINDNCSFWKKDRVYKEFIGYTENAIDMQKLYLKKINIGLNESDNIHIERLNLDKVDLKYDISRDFSFNPQETQILLDKLTTEVNETIHVY